MPERAGTAPAVVLDLHPQRAAKQAFAVLATSKAGVTARHPRLRALIVAKEARGTGVAASMELERGIGRVLAEFSFWPLGSVLTFLDAPVRTWFKIGCREQRKFTCVVPCQTTLSM